MGNKLIIAPNEFLLSYADISAEKVMQGGLALTLDWSEELTDSKKSDAFINEIVNAKPPHISVVISQESDKGAQGIMALLMSPQDYIVASFTNTLPEQAELTEALENWNNYFKALQQHQYLLGEHFIIQVLPTSNLSKEQQALSDAVRSALKSDVETSELLQQFESYSAKSETSSWVNAVSYVLHQHTNVKTTKVECDKANAALNTIKTEKEIIQKELAQKSEKIVQLTQQFEKAQNELASAVKEGTNTQDSFSKLEAEYKGVSNELAIKKEENASIAAENSELKGEGELLRLQIQQLQEELESVFAEANDTKAALADLDKKFKDATNKLTEASKEKQKLTKEKEEQASENELLLLQIQQLQEELEATFLKLSNLDVDFKRIELDNKQLKENAKAEEIASAKDKDIAKTINVLEEEKDLLLLQVNQLQKELGSNVAQSEESKKTNDALIQKLKAKLAQLETQCPELQKELKDAMSEQELLQLQIKQLQEELEFYFTEYQKLKGESPDNKALAEFKNKVEVRFPHLVLSEGVTLTGGANQKDLQRLIARFTQVEHGSKHWNAFSIIVNDRKGVLDIELHAPDKKRVYPLSKFVKTGSNKVCDFSLLSPFTDAGKKALAELPATDQFLLIGIVEELHSKLQQNGV